MRDRSAARRCLARLVRERITTTAEPKRSEPTSTDVCDAPTLVDRTVVGDVVTPATTTPVNDDPDLQRSLLAADSLDCRPPHRLDTPEVPVGVAGDL